MVEHASGRVKRISPEASNALLYAVSAFFSAAHPIGTINECTSAGLSRGASPCSPFVFWAVRISPSSRAPCTTLAQRHRRCTDQRQHRRAWSPGSGGDLRVRGGAAIPLGFEILWRFDGVAGSHLQPEVVTVEVGGQDLVRGTDPYIVPVRLHHPAKTTRPASRTSRDSCPICR